MADSLRSPIRSITTRSSVRVRTGGCAHRIRLARTADHQGDGAARGTLASLPRGGGAIVVVLLSCDETARRRVGCTIVRKANQGQKEGEPEWPVNSMGPGFRPRTV